MAKNNTAVGQEGAIKSWWGNTKEYFTGSYSELKKVHWPGRAQLLGYTGVVLITVILVALIMWLFDAGLSFVLQNLFDAFA